MKVLFFINSLQSGGPGRRLTELMKVLRFKENFEFELVVMDNNIYYEAVLEWDITIHYIIRKIKKDLSVFGRFYKLCKNYHPDIVHCWDSMTATYLVPVCKLLHIKLINGMVVDSPVKQNILNKQWFRARLTFPYSHAIVSNSKAGLLAYNAPPNKSFIIYNGFDFDRTKNLISKVAIKEQLNIGTNYLVGMVATFAEYKDYKTYFKAAEILLQSRKDIVFLAAGNDTDSIVARNMIDLRYRQFFRLLGKKTDVESLINAMDICVLSTFTEGLSNSILEYMAFSKPVIATSGGGTNEIVVDKVTGFLINPTNPEQLADKLQILLNDNKLCAEMGSEGKKRISNKFSIREMVKYYVDLYERILMD